MPQPGGGSPTPTRRYTSEPIQNLKVEREQGCQILLGKTYQNMKNIANSHNIYKRPQNIPKGHKIYPKCENNRPNGHKIN
jgi:hypothetical protein